MFLFIGRSMSREKWIRSSKTSRRESCVSSTTASRIMATSGTTELCHRCVQLADQNVVIHEAFSPGSSLFCAVFFPCRLGKTLPTPTNTRNTRATTIHWTSAKSATRWRCSCTTENSPNWKTTCNKRLYFKGWQTRISDSSKNFGRVGYDRRRFECSRSFQSSSLHTCH